MADGMLTLYKRLSNRRLAFRSLPFFTPIESKDLSAKQKESEVSYFLLYNPLTMEKGILTNFETVARGFLTQAKFYVCPDGEAYKAFTVQETERARLVVSREYGETIRQYEGELHDGFSSKDLFNWIKSTKSPILPQLDEKSQKDVFIMGHLVGLLLTDPDVKDHHEKIISTMRVAVKHFEPHQPQTKRVNFAWLDGIRWASYVQSAFHLTPKDLPRLVIIDALESEYFDSDEKGNIFRIEKPDEIVEYLQAAVDGRLEAKSQLGFLGKSAKAVYKTARPVVELAADQPFTFAFLVMVALLAGLYLISRLLSDGKEYEKVSSSKSD